MVMSRDPRTSHLRYEPMVEWEGLRHAYGPAVDIPDLLARLSPDPDAPVWDELWSRLCHQGTVYSASFAALPALDAAASHWPPTQRAAALNLAAGIVASQDVAGRREQFMRGLDPTVGHLEQLALETIAAPGLSRIELLYLLQDVLAFRGDPLWGRRLDGLADGEFPGVCPSCGADLYLVVGQSGFFTTVEDWVRQPKARRVAVQPSTGELPPVGSWLREQALRVGDTDLATWISHAFGTSRCPECGRSFALPDAIAAAL
jgi:hypothetical protein